MNNYSVIQIEIDNILLNVENPRFEIVNTQDEALNIMISEYEGKIYNLAKHIIENGMNPTELSAVVKTDNNKYKILDGNRRLTALKILRNPNLLNNRFEKLKSKIMKLDRTNVPTTINAIVFQNEEDANLWIKLKHTGENDGVGTVEWTALQQSRFDNNKYPLSIQLIEYLEKNKLMNANIAKNIKNLSITNLERLLSDPDVRNVLSIRREKNKLYVPAANENIKHILNSLLSEILSDNFNVNKIRNKADRTKFINDFKIKYNITKDDIEYLKNCEKTTVKKYETPNKKTEKKESKKSISNNKTSPVTTKNIPKTTTLIGKHQVPEMQSTQDRKTLIPQNFNLTINNKKINDIYLELKDISVKDYPNVVGASFRVFLELSIDYYINEFKNEINLGKKDSLNNKLEKVKLHIKDKLNLDKNELKDISRAISSNDNIVSVDILHGYIHSTVAQASSDGLKTTWNNYERFFELLYNVLNDSPLAKA